MSELERAQAIGHSEQAVSQLSEVKKELNDLLTSRAESIIHKDGLTQYMYGNRPSRLLANKLKPNEQPIYIPSITSEAGTTLTDPKLINQRFCKY